MCRRIDAFTRFRWEGESPLSVWGVSGSQAAPFGAAPVRTGSLQTIGLTIRSPPYPLCVDKNVCLFVRKKGENHRRPAGAQPAARSGSCDVPPRSFPWRPLRAITVTDCRPAATGVVGSVVFPARSVFRSAQCRWARTIIVPALFLACVLPVVIVLLVLVPAVRDPRRPVPGWLGVFDGRGESRTARIGDGAADL